MRVAVIVSIVIGLLIAVLIVVDRLPPQHSPFAPIDLERPIGFATSMQLRALTGNAQACRTALDRSTLVVTQLADHSEGGFCGFTDAVVINRSTVRWSAPVRITCPMAAALYLWERQVVAPAAARHFGSGVARIDHLGTYACRRVYGGVSGRPSQHATANAIDIAGFRLANGRQISVRRDWRGNAAEQAFLRDVHSGGCRLFSAVLGPDYNAAHVDHFHLDMGPFRTCR